MKIFVKTLTGKTITLDVYLESKSVILFGQWKGDQLIFEDSKTFESDRNTRSISRQQNKLSFANNLSLCV